MDFNQISTIFFYVLGPLFFLLSTFVFFKPKFSNGILILEGIVSCIPVLGTILEFLLLLLRGISAELPGEEFYDCIVVGPEVRDNRFNRFFFNKLGWERYDENRKTEEQNGEN